LVFVDNRISFELHPSVLPDGEETNKGIWVPAVSHIVSGHDLSNLKQVALFEFPTFSKVILAEIQHKITQF